MSSTGKEKQQQHNNNEVTKRWTSQKRMACGADEKLEWVKTSVNIIVLIIHNEMSN